MFSAEILFNPSFNMAIGLVIGLCLLAEQERAELIANAKPKPGMGPPRLAPSH
jgi:hypothetical protein